MKNSDPLNNAIRAVLYTVGCKFTEEQICVHTDISVYVECQVIPFS